MPSHLKEAEDWFLRAAQARAVAEQMMADHPRETMLRAAEEYIRLGRLARERLNVAPTRPR